MLYTTNVPGQGIIPAAMHWFSHKNSAWKPYKCTKQWFRADEELKWSKGRIELDDKCLKILEYFYSQTKDVIQQKYVVINNKHFRKTYQLKNLGTTNQNVKTGFENPPPKKKLVDQFQKKNIDILEKF